MKRLKLFWSVSLMVISLATLLLVGSSLTGAFLPVWAARTLGAAELLALPVLVFCTLRLYPPRRSARRDKHSKRP